jgi:RHH-type proline utilization regulon transcriptional repressor/proline dehydrogenase/delta 1-pyrroline-5-carboxylate dehydrogenase
MRAKGHPVFQQGRLAGSDLDQGSYLLPTLIEINAISDLGGEVFGPVLHLLRYRRRDLGLLIEQINATGYGLTLGLHTRIDETIAQVVSRSHAGNQYVNRNMVGAVVGVQPFGGEGLSGTGPKAGGPLYLYRLLSSRPADAMRRAIEWTDRQQDPRNQPQLMAGALLDLHTWAHSQGRAGLARACQDHAANSCSQASVHLPSATGEDNRYSLQPRAQVLCLALNDDDLLLQLAALLAVGSRAVWPASASAMQRLLPASVAARIDRVEDWRSDQASYQLVLHQGDDQSLRSVCKAMAEREGEIVSVQTSADGHWPLERLVFERSLSVNTAAAGGNASLMTLGCSA